MVKRWLFMALGCAAFLTAHAEDVAPQEEITVRGLTQYTLTPSNSWLYVLIKYDRSAWVAGHDHAARATNFSGTVAWDPTDPTKCKVHIEVPLTALKIDPPGTRKHAGLEGETKPNDIPKIESNMTGKNQLQASLFPTITYDATTCHGTHGKVRVEGNLTIHGGTKKVDTVLSITENGATFRARGSFTASHRDFLMKPFTAALGALRNDDALTFTLDLRGEHAP